MLSRGILWNMLLVIRIFFVYTVTRGIFLGMPLEGIA